MPAYGIPCLGFGPGNEPQAHAADEYCPIEDLTLAAAFYAALAATLSEQRLIPHHDRIPIPLQPLRQDLRPGRGPLPLPRLRPRLCARDAASSACSRSSSTTAASPSASGAREPDWDLFSPVERKYYPAYPVGNTPFSPAPRLGERLGLAAALDQERRAQSQRLAQGPRLVPGRRPRPPVSDEKTIVTASTGNAASSLAAVCAAAGRRAVIFVPQSAPRAKLVQMLLCGARVIPVRGSYDDAFRLSLEYTRVRGGLNRNTAYHPLTIEGKKTVGLEIFAQNGMRVPDAILVPVGDGVIISGVYKAFYDLRAAGLMRPSAAARRRAGRVLGRDPRLHRQRDASGRRPRPRPSPIRSRSPCRAIRTWPAAPCWRAADFRSRSATSESCEAQALLAREAGIFAEPAAAAAAAALLTDEARDRLDPDWQIVLLVTGHGLKDIEAPLSRLRIPAAVPAELSAIPADDCRRKVADGQGLEKRRRGQGDGPRPLHRRPQAAGNAPRRAGLRRLRPCPARSRSTRRPRRSPGASCASSPPGTSPAATAAGRS